MAASADDASPSQDPVELLLAGCLGAPHILDAMAAACRDHPEHGDALRQRFAALQRLGLSPSQPAVGGETRRVGRFVLQERLGGGGMGVVWRASEEPLGREVALKLVRHEQVHLEGARKRFLREIEAAAALSHPGIVPILSFGEADGLPWYAMPIVAGRSLGEVLAELRSGDGEPAPAVLRQQQGSWTFACCAVALQVAQALAHAAARGVVHRDVKPSNIMLTDDGRALLIDFGLAQVEGAESMTRSGVQPGSLAYMSPEQVRGEAVDGRTDVWSLGVVLFELLTLQQPFAADTEAKIRSNILAAQPGLSSRSRLPWDVATVLGKALAPERHHRYAGALEFAADLQAVLAHRPIAARRAGALLRLWRLAQRRPTVTTALLLSLLLLTGLPTALLLQERAARRAIERQALTSNRVVALLTDLFLEVDPARARGATVPARVVLDRGARLLEEGLQDEPAVKAALLEAMGTVYLNLGLFDAAASMLVEMQALRAPLLPADAELRARTLEPLARLASARGDAAAAEGLWREVAAARRAVGGQDSNEAAQADLHVATAMWRQDRLAEAEALLDGTVLALRRRLPGDDLQLADAIFAGAEFLQERLDPVRARPLFDEVLAILRARLPKDHPHLLEVQVAAAVNRNALGDYQGAAAELRAALQQSEKVFDPQHPQLAYTREQLAEALVSSSDVAGARAQFDQAFTAYRAIYPPLHAVLARARNLDGTIAFEQGDLVLAEAALDDALRLYRQLYPGGSLELATALSNACRLYLAVGRLDAAAAAGAESLALAEKLGQRDRGARAMAMAHFAYVQVLRGNYGEARAMADAALQLCAEHPQPSRRAFVRSYAAEVCCNCIDGKGAEAAARLALADWDTLQSDSGRGWARTSLGWALELQQRYPEAEAELQQALLLRRRVHGEDHPYVALTLTELGAVLFHLQRLPAAETAFRQAVAIRRKSRSAEDLNLARPLLNLGFVVLMQKRPAEAAPMAIELVLLLRGRAQPGSIEAVSTVKLCLALLRGPAAAAVRAEAAALRELATATLPEGSDTLLALRKALVD